jgi:SAM-dependent methyltransferase
MALTLYRRLTHKELGKITLSGRVLDLGGSKKSEYWRHIKGNPEFVFVNMDTAVEPDMIFDLEQTPYPTESNSFDAVLAINVLEHIWHWRELLKESHRVLKQGGEIVVVVPFLHAVHPSPHDYTRFTKEALLRALEEADFTNIRVTAMGSGVVAASFSLEQRFMPGFLAAFFGYFAAGIDMLLHQLCRALGKKYSPADYPLGYIAIASKK